MMAFSQNAQRLGRRQEGLATLLVTVIILVAITITLIFAAQTSVLEQRMSANEVRMKQTSSAAQGGLERAMAYMQNNSSPQRIVSDDDAAKAFRATFLAPTALDDPTLSSIGDVCSVDPDSFPTGAVQDLELAAGDNFRDAAILSCGWSDDRSSRKTVMLHMQAGPAIANPPENPLITRGGLDVRGNASVYNAYENLTIRSGGGVEISGAAGSTYLRHRDEPRPADDEDVPAPGDPIYQLQSTKDQLGLGVIDRDDNFGVSKDEFFEHFMGIPKAEYKASQVPAGNVHPAGTIEIDSNSWGQVHWVEGDARITGQIGDRDNPVILIVEGDVTARGNFDEFHGILYVMGDLEATGNPEFYGSAVIEGLTEILDENDPNFIAGTPHFIFDPVAASGGARIGARAIVSGSWRDWTSN